MAQIIERLRFAGIRPEEEREVLTTVWRVSMQHQIGDQRLEAGCIDPFHGRAVAGEGKATQQLHLHYRYCRWCHGDLRAFYLAYRTQRVAALVATANGQ